MVFYKYISTLFFALISFSAFAQSSLKINDVSLVAYGARDIDLISVKNNIFYEIYFYYSENDTISPLSVDNDYDETSETSILKNSKIIKVEDITTLKINEFIQNKKYEVVNKNEKRVFSLFNNQIAVLERYEFEDYYDNKKQKNVKDWHLSSTDFESIYMLDIGLGKNIVVLGNNDGYIIPTSKRPIIQYHDINFTNAKIIDYNDENLREKIQYFNGKDFYKIKREAKNKYSLRNNFGGMVINKLYDTIYMNEYFIVGKLNSDIEIYNTSLKKFDTKNIKAAYPKNEIFQSIQILKGNELQDLSFLGEIKQKEKVGRSVCGNVPEWNYSINDKMLTTKTSTYYRKQVEDAIIKIDLSLYFFDTVLFLNNTNEFIYDGNEFASDYIFNLPFKWLLVSKYGKYGVYEFNTDRENWDALKEIIPVEYDSIEASGYHRPLKLKKDNFYTYYNVNKKKYKTLDKYNYHFCRFENEFGKLGWLDYKGNEYYD